MNALIDKAIAIIEATSKEYKRPVILASFGKDSIAMLHLVNRAGKAWPILFHRQPFFVEKYDYANQMIKLWDLIVYDYAPTSCSVLEMNGKIDIFNHYQVGESYTLLPHGNIVEPTDFSPQKWICGLVDIYGKPKGKFNFPWDIRLLGHKASDVDPVQGSMKIDMDFRSVPNTAHCAFPIREWTDTDVWQYIEENKIPIDYGRYEKVDGKWQDRADKTLNSDSFSVCTRCMRQGGEAVVQCPRLGFSKMNNISSLLDKTVLPDYYGEKT